MPQNILKRKIELCLQNLLMFGSLEKRSAANRETLLKNIWRILTSISRLKKLLIFYPWTISVPQSSQFPKTLSPQNIREKFFAHILALAESNCSLLSKRCLLESDWDDKGIFFATLSNTMIAVTCVYLKRYANITYFYFSFRKDKPSWKEIARNKSRLVTQLLKGYDKRIRPYTGGRKENLCNKFHCTFDGKWLMIS